MIQEKISKSQNENTTPHFVRIIESMKEEVSRHGCLTSTISNCLDSIKSIGDDKVASELKQEPVESTFVGAIWDLIFKFREINDQSERNKDRLSEIV